MYCPKPIRGPEFQLSKSCSTELFPEQSVSVFALLNANELRLSTPTWGALPATSLSGIPFALAEACTNVYSGYKAMARVDFFVQPYQFDPESDPEGEAPEEKQTLQLQLDVSEWLVCQNNVSLFIGVVTFTTIYQQLVKAVFVSNMVSKLLDTVCIVSVPSLHVLRLFTVTTKLPHNTINNRLTSNAIA